MSGGSDCAATVASSIENLGSNIFQLVLMVKKKPGKMKMNQKRDTTVIILFILKTKCLKKQNKVYKPNILYEQFRTNTWSIG